MRWEKMDDDGMLCSKDDTAPNLRSKGGIRSKIERGDQAQRDTRRRERKREREREKIKVSEIMRDNGLPVSASEMLQPHKPTSTVTSLASLSQPSRQSAVPSRSNGGEIELSDKAGRQGERGKERKIKSRHREREIDREERGGDRPSRMRNIWKKMKLE